MQTLQKKISRTTSKDSGIERGRFMKRKRGTPKKEPERRQIGCKLDTDLWTRIKILALKKGVTGGELLEDAIREYLAKHE